MHRGWISIHRKIQDNEIWEDKPFSKGQAWIDLLLLANHEEKRIMLGNTKEIVKRGAIVTSISSLSKRWGWSRNKVRTFLDYLEESEMIGQQKDRLKDRRWTLLNVANYSDYQNTQTAKGQVEGQEKDMLRTGYGQVKDTNNNDNNINNIYSNINNIIDSSNSEKPDVKKSEACDAIKMMRREYEERVKPDHSPWEEHQCSGTLERLREEYDGVFDPRWIKWNDYDEKSKIDNYVAEFNRDLDDIGEEWLA